MSRGRDPHRKLQVISVFSVLVERDSHIHGMMQNFYLVDYDGHHLHLVRNSMSGEDNCESLIG
jgi:hypothetical protein